MSIQLVIILIYFAVTVAIGVWSSKKAKSSDSFHGAGLGVIMCVAAGTGEWLGGTSTTGVSQYGWEAGISGAWYTISNAIGVLILAIFFARLYRSLNTVTVPGIMGHFLGKRARTVASVMLIIVMIAVGISQIIAAGSLGQTVLGIPFVVSVLILGVIFIVYTLAGGMNAVGSTNVLHLLAMYGGVVIALIFLATKFGGLDWLTAQLDGMTNAATGEEIDFYSPLEIGMPKVSSWVIAGVLGALTAQAGIQPVLAARDEKVAVKASFITAAVVAPFGILTAFLGMYSRAFYPTADKLVDGQSVNALTTLLMDNTKITPIVGGIVLASILAAVLSTISPIILAAGTMFTKDLYQGYINKDASDRKVLFVSRLSTGIAGLLCMGAGIAFYGSKVLDIVFLAYTFRGALFVILLYGIYWKRSSETSAVLAMITTGVVGGFWKIWYVVTGHYPITDSITETYAAVACAVIMMFVFTLIFPHKGERLTARKED